MSMDGKTYHDIVDMLLCAMGKVSIVRDTDVDLYFNNTDGHTSKVFKRLIFNKKISYLDGGNKYNAFVSVVENYCAKTRKLCYSYKIKTFKV